MTRHKLKRNEFRLESGAEVSIEYWTDATAVHVAAYDTDGQQISTAVYHTSVETADALTPELQESLTNSLANALEYELINNPQLAVRSR